MNIEEQAIRYHRRSFGFYLWHTTWQSSILTVLIAVGGVVCAVLGYWWVTVLAVADVALFAFLLLPAVRGSYRALQKLGDTLEELSRRFLGE